MKNNHNRFDCYEKAIQNPRKDVLFVVKAFQKEFHRKPVMFREDFCGTAAICREFVKSDFERYAVGVDLDAEALEWCKVEALPNLSSGSDRIELVKADCREYLDSKQYDIVLANNYSLFLLTSRKDLIKYLSLVYKCLPNGMFFCDLTGGSDCFQKSRIKRHCNELTYIWEQDHYNFIDSSWRCGLSFAFQDGSYMKHAFRYTWRLWSIAEIIDALKEVGFVMTKIWVANLEQIDGNETPIYEETAVLPGSIQSWNAIIASYIEPR